jgi:hypothetical protein
MKKLIKEAIQEKVLKKFKEMLVKRYVGVEVVEDQWGDDIRYQITDIQFFTDKHGRMVIYSRVVLSKSSVVIDNGRTHPIENFFIGDGTLEKIGDTYNSITRDIHLRIDNLFSDYAAHFEIRDLAVVCQYFIQ